MIRAALLSLMFLGCGCECQRAIVKTADCSRNPCAVVTEWGYHLNFWVRGASQDDNPRPGDLICTYLGEDGWELCR